MTLADIPARLAAWFAARPTHTKVLLAVATAMFLIELGLRRFAPRSTAYAKWTALFHAIGAFWTAIILSLVYFLSVSAVSLGMKLARKDPLDRRLGPEPTFWRPHEPNPLGARAAARHQF